MKNGRNKPATKTAAPEPAVPKAVVSRLSLYLRELQRLLRDGRATVSSHQLGRLLGFTDAQVRKDLAYFGQFGYPGIGYRCEELVAAVRKILGTHERWPVAIVGAGNLGRALLGYKGFRQQGFNIVAAFDIEPATVGQSIEGVRVYHASRLSEVVAENKIRRARAGRAGRGGQAGGGGYRGDHELRAGHAVAAAWGEHGRGGPGNRTGAAFVLGH
jgi:redox-sensing transcriptional repressor